MTDTKPSVRGHFAATFGEDNAEAIMSAAIQHQNGVHDNRGLEHGDLGDHDGDCDYLALMCGAYKGWLPTEVSA